MLLLVRVLPEPQPSQDRSPVLGTNYLEFDWIAPNTGLRF